MDAQEVLSIKNLDLPTNPSGHPEYTTTAAGLLAMQVCGQYESPFVLGAADWLLDNAPKTNRKFFFYGTTTMHKQCTNGARNMRT